MIKRVVEIAVVLATLFHAASCRTTVLAHPRVDTVIELGTGWLDDTAGSEVGRATLTSSGGRSRLELLSDHSQPKRVAYRLEALALRGRRVMVTDHVSVRGGSETAFATMRLTVVRKGGKTDAWDGTNSERVTVEESTLRAALDIANDALELRIELAAEGGAIATFDPPRLVDGPVTETTPLTAGKLEAVRALTNVVAYLRFFHPSDQVVAVDWRALETELVRRIITADDRAKEIAVLQDLVRSVAPTALLYGGARRSVQLLPSIDKDKKLTRFVHLGLGGFPYTSFRTGMAEPTNTGVTVLRTAHVSGCGRAEVRLSAAANEASPGIKLLLISRQGPSSNQVASHEVGVNGEIAGDIPADTTDVSFGIQVGGPGTITVSTLELRCDGRTTSSFAAKLQGTGQDTANHTLELSGTGSHLYKVTQPNDCHDCLRIERPEEREYITSRDEVDLNIGLGLRLQVPLALWTDGQHTFPSVAAPESPSPVPDSDIASRIATAIDVWMTLHLFYPYFHEVQTDWSQIFERTVIDCASAVTPAAQLSALSRLVAALHDDHAEIYRPATAEGLLPLAFKKLGADLYTVGGVANYGPLVPRGAVLEAINGETAASAIARTEAMVSAATDGWRSAMTPLVLGSGAPGEFVTLTLREPDGSRKTLSIPRVERSKFIFKLHEPRPDSGQELSPRVFYVDANTLDKAKWDELAPKLGDARAVILDLRGGSSPGAFQLLSHFITHEIKSPYWDIPITTVTGITGYERLQLSIVPAAPLFAGRLIFVTDGRTASASETILQYARAARIGRSVGEPSGGTNGNVSTFDTVARLRVRFTGLRTINQDGSRFHGIGVQPDVVVHPTPEGLRAGRDEILEAALAQVTNN